jgi:hypothetical protein
MPTAFPFPFPPFGRTNEDTIFETVVRDDEVDGMFDIQRP